MNKNCTYLVVVFFIANMAFSQIEKMVFGTIICDNKMVANIQITNLVSEKSTVSNPNGTFSILAKPDDMLVFTSIDFEYKHHFLEPEDIIKNNIIIQLVKKIEQLDEVVVYQSNEIDAVKLGILDKPVKSYTPAERRLKNAGKVTPELLLTGLAGLSLPIEPIINAISGKTKNLKNELNVEKKELLLIKISYLYEDNYYTNKLKIDKSLIKAFQYFALEDEKFIAALQSKNKTKINFSMIELARIFNKLQTNQK